MIQPPQGPTDSRPIVAYLIQGSADNLANQAFPIHAPVYQLSYDRVSPDPQVRASLFSSTASWAEGRNLLLDAALKDLGASIDYFVFCDDDVAFIRGGFEDFEALLARTRPAVAFPLMPKAKQSPTLAPGLAVQRALAIDEQMVAVHRSLVGVEGLAPLVTRYDHVSWYVSSLIFEYLCLTQFAELSHQYNEVEISNEGHIWESGATLYNRGDFGLMLEAVKTALTQITGGYDSAVIEQFDPDAAQNLAHRIRDRSRLGRLPADADMAITNL